MIFYRCSNCMYFSDRKYNLQKHIDRKHRTEIEYTKTTKNGQNVSPTGQNVSPNEQNVSPNEQNVSPNEQNVSRCNLFCVKCNKVYKTEKNLKHHIEKCRGVDELTCSKCMASFTTRAAKSKHIKKNKCKAKSIIHARTSNVQNITNNTNNINNSTYIEKQYNNIYINNFGSERIDHITKEEICQILTSGINTIPLYIEKKHFDRDFPENNNIAFTNENKCKVLEDSVWKEKDIGILSSQLIEDNSEVLLLYCEDNKIELSNQIKDDEILDRIKDKLIIIYNKSDCIKYKEILGKIKDLVKNSNKSND